MLKLNFQKYFDGTENAYYDARYIITILEKMLDKSFDEIKANVSEAKVSLSKEEIMAYLEQQFEEENPELKQRFETRKFEQESASDMQSKRIQSYGTIEEESQFFTDNIALSRYQFESYTLKYFNTYIEIVREKLLTLLNTIEQIGNRNVASVQDIITELDIVLDENGNISKEDIIRLLTPTIYNLADLNKKTEEANDLSTYLTFKMSKHTLMRDGWSEGEIYPSTSLQKKGLYDFNGNKSVKLSSKQEKERIEKQRKNSKTFAKSFLS